MPGPHKSSKHSHRRVPRHEVLALPQPRSNAVDSHSSTFLHLKIPLLFYDKMQEVDVYVGALTSLFPTISYMVVCGE